MSDQILVATKTCDVPSLAPWFAPLIGPDTHVAVPDGASDAVVPTRAGGT